MEMMLYLLVFLTVTITAFLLIRIFTFQRDSVRSRLKELEYLDPVSEEEDEYRLSLGDRLIKPSYQKLIKFLGSAAPKNFRSQYERLMEISGSNNNMNFNRMIGLQFLLAAFLGILLFLISNILDKPNILFSLCAGLIGFLLPFFSLKTKAKRRQEVIQNSLPDMLDLIYVSVEAGLSFDMAVQRTTEKMKGPLADELKKALDEINKGKRREDSLRAIVKRTEVRDLSSFVTSIIQTEQLGSNIANVLRIQSSTMRQKRRQRAEEKAMKVPVKILFPMVFFIFPPLFIVVLGPVIINVVVNFL